MKRTATTIIRRTRPAPPSSLLGASDPYAFVPSPDLADWARSCFIDEDGILANGDHAHLEHASIGWLWALGPAASAGRAIMGEASMPVPPGATWARQRGSVQLSEWFGHVPDFLITLSAPIAATLDDASFCALVEHEMYHCAQAVDDIGLPRFTRHGDPVFTMRGHDVEEFVGVVARYGADASGVGALVRAANAPPSVSRARIATACGTCAKRAA